MAFQLRHGLALQHLVKQLENISLRRLSTSSTSSIEPGKLLVCSSLNPWMNRCQPTGLGTHCSAKNKTEIQDKVKHFVIIETPKVVGINTHISDPLSSVNKPIETPETNKVIVEPPASLVPKSASKNGNKYVLNIKKKRRKRRQLEKLRSRIWPVRKKLNFLRTQKREIRIQEQCDVYKKEAEEYDALEVITKDLEIAKKNGYFYDIFGKSTKTFGFGEDKKEEPEPVEPEKPAKPMKRERKNKKEWVDKYYIEPEPEPKRSLDDLLKALKAKKGEDTEETVS